MEGDSFHPLRCGALETSRRGAPVADEFHEWNLLQDVFSGRNGGSGTGDSGREKLDGRSWTWGCELRCGAIFTILVKIFAKICKSIYCKHFTHDFSKLYENTIHVQTH